YDLPVASAQVKSCILVAAIAAEGETTLTEPAPSRDHTERMLLAGGVGGCRDAGGLHVRGGEPLTRWRIRVPGDLPSAAVGCASGVRVARARVVERGVGVNWARTGFLRILGRMGASVVGELEEPDAPLGAGEPIEDLEVVHGRLVGTVVEAAEVPLAIDELPLVGLVGCFAEGETVVRGAGELRLKESDRIATVVDGL